MAATGIQVGDAFVKFTGDTTGLSAAYASADKMGQTFAKNQVAVLKPMNDELDATSDNVAYAGEKMDEAGKKGKKAFQDTKNSIDLLSAQIGVGLPRELKRWLAELPGAQAALSGAFQATAVLALAGFVADLTEKVTQFVIEAFILTDVMKQNDAAFAKLNGTISEQVIEIKKLHDEYQLIGLEGSAKFSEQIQQLNIDLAKDTQAIATNRDTIDTLKKKYDELANSKEALVLNALPGSSGLDPQFQKELESAAAAVKLQEDTQRQLENNLKIHLQTRENLEKDDNVTIKQETEDTADARIQAQTKLQGALALLDLNTNRLAVVQATGSYQALAQLQVEYENAEIQRQIDADRRLIATKDQTKEAEKNQVIALNADIKTLEDQRIADQTKRQEDFQAKVKEILASLTGSNADILKSVVPNAPVIVNTTDAITGMVTSLNALEQIIDPTAEQVKQLDSAFQALGLGMSSVDLQGKARQQADALEAVAVAEMNGIATLQELKDAQIAYLQTQLQITAASDMDTAAKIKQTAAIQNQMKALQTVAIPTITRWKEVQKMASQDVVQALGSAVSAYATGQATIGQAMKQMTQQILSALASQAIVEAVIELARGFAALSPLSPDFGHAGEHFTAAAIFGTVGVAAAAAGHAMGNGQDSSSGPGGNSGPGSPITTSGAGSPQQPVNTVSNVPRFATGAILTRPTMMSGFIAGDARSSASQPAAEGILPLEDPQATEMLRNALASTVELHVHVSNDVGTLVNKINSRVKKGQSRLISSTTTEVRKRA